MNYWQAQRLMATARWPHKGKPIGNNTRLYDNDGYYTIRLHNNVIMEIYPDGFIPLDAGWQTVTTKARLNEHMRWVTYIRGTGHGTSPSVTPSTCGMMCTSSARTLTIRTTL